ncbi:hypothetical protein QZH41_001445 [Actinostola sp. cb2023]|nr:hypothetical protein QZH41_001445 [Actinostola sp. cb2023]
MLDQFYSDAESVTGDELLAEAYNLRQQDNEEVAAFASRLDNQVRLTKLRQCELLPDDNAVDKHLRILFWAGLRQGIKDKARHKKDQYKTFGELITAARYGEKEANNSTQDPSESPGQTQCNSREVREVLKEGIQKKEVVNHIKPNEAEQREKVNELLKRQNGVFAQDDKDLGCSSEIKHEIVLTDLTPVRDTYRRVPPGQFEEFKNAVCDLLAGGIIRESKSPYASPVVLVRNKDGSLRVCVDFRKINAKTVRLPRITERVEALQGSQWFCSLDLQSGYLQVEVEEKDNAKTAMTTPFGLFEFNRMPFGLTNAPATFQRLMERCLTGLNLQICLAYLDDIIVFAKSFEEILSRLDQVFDRLSGYGLKLKPSKCSLFQTELKYLRHIVSREGVSPDPDKVKALKE